MKSIKLLFVFLSFLPGFAQDLECGAQDPGEDPASYNRYEINGSEQIEIPVKIYILRRDDGSGGINEMALADQLDLVNTFFDDADLEIDFTFNVCGDYTYIDDTDYYHWHQAEGWDIINTYEDDNTLNFFFAGSVTSSSGASLAGYAYYPSSWTKVLVIRNTSALNGSTLAHELGHNLNLKHTHGASNVFGSTSELVDGSNGATAGDRVADTPADPNLWGWVNSDCTHNLGPTNLDANGDQYDPSTINFMIYSKTYCRTEFTQGQKLRAVEAYHNYYSGLNCQDNSLNISESDPALVRVWPVPFKNELNMGRYVDYKIYNQVGQLVLSGSGSRIFTDRLSAGLYFLEMKIENKITTKKILK
jgi:hypothetical protein